MWGVEQDLTHSCVWVREVERDRGGEFKSFMGLAYTVNL